MSTRATAVISEEGIVLLSYPEVDVSAKGHVAEVFADCAKLFQ